MVATGFIAGYQENISCNSFLGLPFGFSTCAVVFFAFLHSYIRLYLGNGILFISQRNFAAGSPFETLHWGSIADIFGSFIDIDFITDPILFNSRLFVFVKRRVVDTSLPILLIFNLVNRSLDHLMLNFNSYLPRIGYFALGYSVVTFTLGTQSFKIPDTLVTDTLPYRDYVIFDNGFYNYYVNIVGTLDQGTAWVVMIPDGADNP